MLMVIIDCFGKIIGVVIGVINLVYFNFFDVINVGKYGLIGDYVVMVLCSWIYVVLFDKCWLMKIGLLFGVNVVYDCYINGYEGLGVVCSLCGVVEFFFSKCIVLIGWLMQLVLLVDEVFVLICVMQCYLLVIFLIFIIFVILVSWWWL